MTENDRLKTIRTKLQLTQRLFSQALEIKQGSYSDVERGKAGISAVLLKNLVRKFRVNPLWVCEGEGNMFIGDFESWQETSESITIKPSSILGTEDLQIQQLERQQQNLQNLKNIIDFLKD